MKVIRDCPPRDWRTLDQGQATPQELVESHFGLVSMVMKRRRRFLARGDIPMEDLFQAGCLGLVIAANRFDPRKGATFSTYAKYWVIEMMQRLVAKSKPWPILGKEAIERMQVRQNESSAEQKDLVTSLLGSLDPRERVVITQCVMLGVGEKIVAQRMGVSHQRINRIKHRALSRMAAMAKEEGEAEQ